MAHRFPAAGHAGRQELFARGCLRAGLPGAFSGMPCCACAGKRSTAAGAVFFWGAHQAGESGRGVFFCGLFPEKGGKARLFAENSRNPLRRNGKKAFFFAFLGHVFSRKNGTGHEKKRTKIRANFIFQGDFQVLSKR
ncbi:hypothetical protein [Mailhella massiliensis]|uniref:hypothetical protein n=1 Tax=Mailhella massiliensis TaxID=1903261 RepID=UPI001184FDD7|nr:hypothetical protein [Mailhella massiliensis]